MSGRLESEQAEAENGGSECKNVDTVIFEGRQVAEAEFEVVWKERKGEIARRAYPKLNRRTYVPAP